MGLRKLFEFTVVFWKLWKAINAKNPDGSRKFNVMVLEGGSRSSKTFSTIQAILLLCLGAMRGAYKSILICRKDSQRARDTVWADFIKALKFYGLYKDKNVTKQPMGAVLGDSEINCRGLLDYEKVVGAETDITWLNEANQISQDAFDELEQRNRGFMILDYNPNFLDDHWIVTSVLKRDDVAYIHSTMLDNPFLPKKIIDKIKSYEPTPENKRKGTANAYKWNVYGLGIRGTREGLVFPDWEECPEIPAGAKLLGYGQDYGFTNDPTTCVAAYRYNGAIYLDEIFYRKGMLNRDIARAMKEAGIGKKDRVVGDSAEPKTIEEIYQYGFNIEGVAKGKDSINYGIALMQEYKIFVTKRSTNLIKELRQYLYAKDKHGKSLNKPIDAFNHLIDAARYIIMTVLKKVKKKKGSVHF